MTAHATSIPAFLLVGDDGTWAPTLATDLAKLGHVTVARTSKDALEVLRSGPGWSALFISPPDGLDLVAAIRKLGISAPALVLVEGSVTGLVNRAHELDATPLPTEGGVDGAVLFADRAVHPPPWV